MPPPALLVAAGRSKPRKVPEKSDLVLIERSASMESASSSTSLSFRPPKKIFATASEKTANIDNNRADVDLNIELLGKPEKTAMPLMAEQALLPESSQDSSSNATNGKMEDEFMDSTEVQAELAADLRSAVVEEAPSAALLLPARRPPWPPTSRTWTLAHRPQVNYRLKTD
jgi:hypothetical protein